MSSEEEHVPELTPFEAALAGLTPRVEGFDREELIFQAGRVSVLRESFVSRPRSGWRWPAAFAAMTAVAAVLTVMLSIRPAPQAGSDHQPAAAVAPRTADGNSAGPPATPADAGESHREAAVDRASEAVAEWLSRWSAENAGVSGAPDRGDSAHSLTYPQLRDRLLRSGLDPRPTSPGASTGPVEVAAGPFYRQLRDQLLKMQASVASLPDAPGGVE